MARFAALTLLVMFAILALAQTRQPEPQQPSVTLPPELQRVLTDYQTAWAAKDAAALSTLFAEDGFVLPSGSQPLRGREKVREFYTGKGGPLSLRAFAYAAEGSVAYILGGYAGKKGDPDAGKFTLTLKRVDGRWLIMSDMDSSNRRGQ